MWTDPASSLLTDAAALARSLASPRPPVLLDVRWKLGGPRGISEFRAGRLPGAVFVDLDRDLASTPGSGGRHPLPAAGPFQAAMRRAGVGATVPVVVYDESDATAAARCWWLLRYFGHPQTAVLDGGYRGWVAAGGAVETGDGTVPAGGDFTARPGQAPLLDAQSSARLARDGVLLDARAAERYRGENEPVDPVAGHIPGAVSAPTAGNVGPGRPVSAPGRAAGTFRRARRRRRGAGGRVLRLRRDRRARGAGAGAGRPAGGAVRRVLVGMDHRPGAPGRHRLAARLTPPPRRPAARPAPAAPALCPPWPAPFPPI